MKEKKIVKSNPKVKKITIEKAKQAIKARITRI